VPAMTTGQSVDSTLLHRRPSLAEGSRRRVRLLVGVATIGLLVMLASWQPAVIAYHRRHMMSAWNDCVNARQPSKTESFPQQVILRHGDNPNLHWERYEYHRDRLVAWGELAHREFVLQHIVAQSEESKELWRRLVQTFPGHIHVTSPWPRTPEPMRIEVWDHPGRLAQWEAFVAEHDVSDFRSRFLPGSDEHTTMDAQEGR